MATISDNVRPLAQFDLSWVLDVGAARRERIVSYAPTFWKAAPTAREVHHQFLSNQIDDPDVVSIRTEHGFLFGAPRGDLLVVDDMALEDDNAWDTEGQQLLRSTADRSDLRFVCPVPEPPRTHTAVTLGMTIVESWWHKDIDPNVPPIQREDSSLTVDGASGRLVPAPPIYTPGGPVLLVFAADSAEALAAIEQKAATAGTTVSVVTQRPTNDHLTDLLSKATYKRTTDFFEWRRNA